MRRLCLAALLAAAAAVPVRALTVERISGVGPAGRACEVVAGEALVRFAAAAGGAQRAAALRGLGAAASRDLPGGWTHVRLPTGLGVAAGLARLRSLPGVLEAAPNHFYRALRTPNDPFVSSQWALNVMEAFQAWDFETGASSRTTVAVIDSGIDGTQPDLAAKLTAGGHVFCDPDTGAPCVAQASPTPACDHATRVSGVAAASSDNSLGVAGLSWGAQLLSLKVFNDADCATDCSGASCGTDDATIIKAIAYAQTQQGSAAFGHIVLNLSLGGSGACSAPLAAALAAAATAGMPAAIAAGNDGSSVNSPANCAADAQVIAAGGGVLPVGATDSSDAVATWSSRGAELASYGVAAPGVAVMTTDLSSGYASADGTSFASPQVAGLAALLLSARPTSTPGQVQQYIRAGADSIKASADAAGTGRVNARRALCQAVGCTKPSTETYAFPNPLRLAQANGATLAVPDSLQGGDATIRIYTVSGALVRELTGVVGAGSAGLVWDGRNAAGTLVASGTYFFVVSTGKGKSRGRVAVIR